jgi:hypothetical protein
MVLCEKIMFGSKTKVEMKSRSQWDAQCQGGTIECVVELVVLVIVSTMCCVMCLAMMVGFFVHMFLSSNRHVCFCDVYIGSLLRSYPSRPAGIHRRESVSIDARLDKKLHWWRCYAVSGRLAALLRVRDHNADSLFQLIQQLMNVSVGNSSANIIDGAVCSGQLRPEKLLR